MLNSPLGLCGAYTTSKPPHVAHNEVGTSVLCQSMSAHLSYEVAQYFEMKVNGLRLMIVKPKYNPRVFFFVEDML